MAPLRSDESCEQGRGIVLDTGDSAEDDSLNTHSLMGSYNLAEKHRPEQERNLGMGHNLVEMNTQMAGTGYDLNSDQVGSHHVSCDFHIGDGHLASYHTSYPEHAVGIAYLLDQHTYRGSVGA